MNDTLEVMVHDIGVDAFKKFRMEDTLERDMEKSLYLVWEKFIRLSAVLRLFNLKTRDGWTDRSFTEFLELLQEMLPKCKTLLNRSYEAKKILCPMSLDYVKMHECHNDWILYRKEYENLKKMMV